ncbi:MAG: ABC transporter permease [Candidatus Heimdallarchaeota archaeon]|nr:ABC transporter permease [Candidatus Heimdallarchaeota archaeon]
MNVVKEEKLESRMDKIPVGFKKSVTQVGATVTFEFKRNLKNMFISFGIAVGIYILSLVINLIQEGRGAESPASSGEYLTSYLGMMGFFILIIAIMFAGNIIALDYDKHTGNLIFPKITKGRLFLGRVIARYLLSVLAVLVYYVLVGATALIKYGDLPIEILASLGWAILYTFAVFALVAFFSSFLKKTSTTIVVSLVMMLMVFNLGTTILMMTGVTWEPLFILTYYANIISYSIGYSVAGVFVSGLPTERFLEGSIGPGVGGDGPTFMRWITPDITGALIGMIIYSVVLIVAAYFFFRRRQ